MRALVRLFLLCAVVAAPLGCATVRRWWKKDREPDAHMLAQSRRPLARLGVVAVVDEREGFVLIDTGPSPGPAAETPLRSYAGAAPTAQLKASAVRRRPFVVAEIVEGAPRRGDEVFESSAAPLSAPPR